MQSTVLVLRALGLGDFLTAVPALRALRRWYAHSTIVLAAPQPFETLLPLVGAVDELWPTPELRAFEWPRPSPEIAVNLHGKGPRSLDALRATDASLLLTHAHSTHPEVDGPEWADDQHETARWVRLLRFYGIPGVESDLVLSPPRHAWDFPTSSSTHRGRRRRPRTARFRQQCIVHPGAGFEARQWPAERFASIAGWLRDSGEDVVVTGDATQRPLAERVAALAGLPAAQVLAGRTSLVDLAARVSRAKLVLAGDTGIAHLASAYRTPSVVLFGPVSPAHWGPPDDAAHIPLWTGRTGDTFAREPFEGLLELTTERVRDAVASALAHSERQPT